MRALIAALVTALFLVPTTDAGMFSRRSETQKPKQNREALVYEVMDASSWATPEIADGIINFFNRRTKRLLNRNSQAELAFLIIEYRTLALGAIARTEGPMLTIELNYVPERFELASLRQQLDCMIERDGPRLLLRFRDAETDGLTVRRPRSLPELRIDAIINRLSDETSPFESVVQLR